MPKAKKTLAIPPTTRCRCGAKLFIAADPPARFETQDVVVPSTTPSVSGKPDLSGITGEPMFQMQCPQCRRHWLVRVIVGEADTVVDMVQRVFESGGEE